MKKIALTVAILSLGLVACEGSDPVDRNYSTTNTQHNTVDECPRADGQPCK